MTDTSQPADYDDYEEDEDDSEELLPDLYVEIATSLIYEVRFLETCAIVRPVTPHFYLAIRKLAHSEFAKEFEEFLGDRDAVREFVRGLQPEFIVGN
jgi:hypothetical protein